MHLVIHQVMKFQDVHIANGNAALKGFARMTVKQYCLRLGRAKLQAFGSDPSARDCTRVLRIVGSINSKNDVQVTGWVLQPCRWTLHELADALAIDLEPNHH